MSSLWQQIMGRTADDETTLTKIQALTQRCHYVNVELTQARGSSYYYLTKHCASIHSLLKQEKTAP